MKIYNCGGHPFHKYTITIKNGLLQHFVNDYDISLYDIHHKYNITLYLWNPKKINNKIYNISGLNNPSNVYKYAKNKSDFFELLISNGYSKYCPFYMVDKFILKHNSSSSGKNTNLYDNLIVKYYDTFSSKYNAYIAYRVIMYNNNIVFFYPLASTTHWCIHTKNCNIDKELYIQLYKESDKLLDKYKYIFENLYKILKLNIFAIDFIISNNNLYILEIEIKYGYDINFVKNIINKYKIKNFSFKNIIKFKNFDFLTNLI